PTTTHPLYLHYALPIFVDVAAPANRRGEREDVRAAIAGEQIVAEAAIDDVGTRISGHLLGKFVAGQVERRARTGIDRLDQLDAGDRKSTRLNSSHVAIS